MTKIQKSSTERLASFSESLLIIFQQNLHDYAFFSAPIEEREHIINCVVADIGWMTE